MKSVFKQVLQALFSRQKAFSHAELLNRSSSELTEINNKLAGEKCQRILNYWLDAELFDLPECPVYNQKDTLSIPVDDFMDVLDSIQNQFNEGKLKITKDSRLLVMFQCHRAGYISKDDEQHPNEEIPRTYLVAQALIPIWNEELQCLVWNRSEEEADLIINLAAMRTLYRRCKPSSAQNMSLSDWIEARIETIENLLQLDLQPEDEETLLTNTLLCEQLNKINRKLANEFWPEPKSRDFMLSQCQSLESRYQEMYPERLEDEQKYAPVATKTGDITFRWRFCFYPDGTEKNQLGPFFVKDLEHCISHVSKQGIAGLSVPLQNYLLGRQQQIEIKSATNNGKFFHGLTNKPILGRWPEDPEYGLSLLQNVAVNVALDRAQNPLVAVNGPPGTGKTTLLKDVIASHFIERTIKLAAYVTDENWLDKPEVIHTIMQHSMVVASSNNKAVENISKELPASHKVYDDYRDLIGHFSKVSPVDTWGLFCAVLGNSENRSAFKVLLKKLANHLKNIDDYFRLNPFCTDLEKLSKNETAPLIRRYIETLAKEKKLSLLAVDVRDSHAAKNNHAHFLGPFADALQKIEKGELVLDSFVRTWEEFNNEQWVQAKTALLTFKKQWFGAKKADIYLKTKLDHALTNFAGLCKKFKELDLSDSKWKLDAPKFVTKPSDYDAFAGETSVDSEARLQQSSPLGCKDLNHLRSSLFVAALKLNEAMLESVGKKLANCFGEIELLIDGRLETNEKSPEHQKLWSRLFLFFPVVSTSLSSTENQFRLMQKAEGFGLAMFDEAGQAVNYHVVGLLQRSRQAIFVGDPIQLEPVVSMSQSIDLAIAEDFMVVSRKDDEVQWGDHYLVSRNSAQAVADRASRFVSLIGERKVGIPLLVHRRCTEPMFSIANKIAYDGKMVNASAPFGWEAIQSGWINVSETESELGKRGYANEKEARTAIELVKHLAENQPNMLKNGIYIITPFTLMQRELKSQWKSLAKKTSNHHWMGIVSGGSSSVKEIESFAEGNIGTVHTFQGKEASTVILCCAASKIRNKNGGISWVNGKPNLINVAVTRAKHHLFVLGNASDWAAGKISSELQSGGMKYYDSFDYWQSEQAKLYNSMSFCSEPVKPETNKQVFIF